MSARPGVRRCPEAVLTAIPWYPDRGLTDAERGAVEAHAAGCATCRREIEWMLGRATEPQADAPDRERVFARLQARIDAERERSDAAPDGTAHVALRPHAGAARTRRVGRWAAGVAAALVLVSAAAFWLGGERARYQTATAPAPVGSPPTGEALDVVFRDDASAAQISAALRALGARVVSGPTPLGVYRVRLSGPQTASEVASRLRAEGTGVASFAEPVDR